ncbi:unnamed protein product, partial [Effrenium voratum]
VQDELHLSFVEVWTGSKKAKGTTPCESLNARFQRVCRKIILANRAFGGLQAEAKALRQSYRRASRDFAHFSDTAAREFHVE